ncbi:pyridoxamine 5'-phosphate oxidase family protein, partial [uncultured Sphingomonas sp.]|uniref:pyridoxamine 5'-phosphate oxidase family protein n=1 Tax=uncultured Sphingomonas sp. TaxID=158754 RepID=UPI0035CBF8D8
SPKGLDSFRVLDAGRVAYVDLGGSGNETQAHLAADGRITVMFCAFDNPSSILRLYGHGSAVLPQDEGFDALATHFPRLPGIRQVFAITIDSVQVSCGWGVPRMTLDRSRDTLTKFHARQIPEERLAKIAGRTKSIDGLPVRVQTRIPAA